MAICMDYIKSGEILKAPRLDFKYQYLLKCNECEECFCLLEPFIEHCTSHEKRDTSLDDLIVMEVDEGEYDDDNDDVDVADVDDHDQDINKGEYEDEDDNDDEQDQDINIGEYEDNDDEHDQDQDLFKLAAKDRIVNINFVMNAEKQESKSDSDEISEKEEFYSESLEEEELSDVEEDTELDTNKSVNDEFIMSNSGNDATSVFTQKFMTSKENVSALLDAYEQQPKLWNNKFTKQLKNKTDRIKCMQQIATKLQHEKNLEITIKEVAAVLAHLRLMYRIKLEREKSHLKYQNAEKFAWLFERLQFLKPFLDSHPIAVLDSHPHDLRHEEILQLFEIYKRYPQLWNCETLESCCKNKRSEALDQMLKDIILKMDIEIDRRNLEKYLHVLHSHFSREKKRKMGILVTKDPRFEYYQHALYLYDYLGPFRCDKCKRVFRTLLKLKEHQYEHGGVLGLHCPQCEKAFKTVEPYVAHVRRHMNDLGVECQECGRRFLRMADLKVHMRIHTGVKPFTCDVCGISFRHSQDLTMHKRRHMKQYSHNCTVCSKGCYSRRELDIHMRTHGDVRDFVCSICGKAFKTQKTMQQHTFTHEEGRNHICPVCGKTYKNLIGLRHHSKTHNKKKTKK